VHIVKYQPSSTTLSSSLILLFLLHLLLFFYTASSSFIILRFLWMLLHFYPFFFLFLLRLSHSFRIFFFFTFFLATPVTHTSAFALAGLLRRWVPDRGGILDCAAWTHNVIDHAIERISIHGRSDFYSIFGILVFHSRL